MSDLKFKSGISTLQLFQSSDLNSLASAGYAYGSGSGVSSNIFDNTSAAANGGLLTEADIVILLGSFNPSGSPYVTLAMLWSPDGTNFPDPQTAGAPIAGTPVYSAGVNTGSSAKVITIPRVLLRPLKCKFVFGNVTGTTLAASANSITIAPATYAAN